MQLVVVSFLLGAYLPGLDGGLGSEYLDLGSGIAVPDCALLGAKEYGLDGNQVKVGDNAETPNMGESLNPMSECARSSRWRDVLYVASSKNGITLE